MQCFIIVDDSRAIQSIIRRAIIAGGYNSDSVHVVSSGSEALDLVGTLKPDLIITDWHMPGMSGLELVQTLRQTGHQLIKVGLVTTEKSEARMAEARNNGVDFILHKPFKDSDLIAAIELSVGSPGDAQEPEVPSAEPEVIASVDAVTKILKATLPTHAFTLRKADLAQLDISSMRVLLGLYSKAERKSVDALCVMDMACAELIGSAVLGYNPLQMQSALASDAGREVIVESVSSFLKQVAALFPSLDKVPHKLARSSILGFESAPLKKALHHNAGVQVYELQIQGLGRGCFALLKLTA
ncbi:response regulator [Propionivibrio sp.]|uniref:response regulator n=1 Tax=Propionivibrio sp. TaxID=2212460 RepID=UPI003BF36EB3